MKKVLLGATIGVAIGYMIKKMQEEGCFDKLCDCMSSCGSKSKRYIEDAIDEGKNQAEYISEQVSDAVQKGKDKLDDMVNK